MSFKIHKDRALGSVSAQSLTVGQIGAQSISSNDLYSDSTSNMFIGNVGSSMHSVFLTSAESRIVVQSGQPAVDSVTLLGTTPSSGIYIVPGTSSVTWVKGATFTTGVITESTSLTGADSGTAYEIRTPSGGSGNIDVVIPAAGGFEAVPVLLEKSLNRSKESDLESNNIEMSDVDRHLKPEEASKILGVCIKKRQVWPHPHRTLMISYWMRYRQIKNRMLSRKMSSWLRKST